MQFYSISDQGNKQEGKKRGKNDKSYALHSGPYKTINLIDFFPESIPNSATQYSMKAPFLC